MAATDLSAASNPIDGAPAERHQLNAYRFFYTAAGLIAFSACVPWVGAIGIALYPYGKYVVVIFVIAALYAGEGYLVQKGRATSGTTLAVWILDLVVVIGVLWIFNGFGGFGSQWAGPAAGFFVAVIGVAAAIKATVELHRTGARVPEGVKALAARTGVRIEPIAAASGSPPAPPETKICPNGHRVAQAAEFCGECGTAVLP